MPLGRPLRSLLEQQRVKRRRSTRFGQGDPACVKPQMRRGGRVVRLRDSVRVWRPDAAHYAQSRLSRQVVPRFPSRERSTTPHDGKDGAAAHVETEHSDCQDTCDRGFLKPHLLPWPKMTEMVSRRCRTQDGHRVDRAGGRAVTGTGGERRYRARSRASGAAWKVGARRHAGQTSGVAFSHRPRPRQLAPLRRRRPVEPASSSVSRPARWCGTGCGSPSARRTARWATPARRASAALE